MRTREKISILKRMKKLIQDDISYGFCYAYYTAIHKESPNYYDPEWVNKVIELGLNPPKCKHMENWWYPMLAKAPRIRAINRLLKKLENPK